MNDFPYIDDVEDDDNDDDDEGCDEINLNSNEFENQISKVKEEENENEKKEENNNNFGCTLIIMDIFICFLYYSIIINNIIQLIFHMSNSELDKFFTILVILLIPSMLRVITSVNLKQTNYRYAYMITSVLQLDFIIWYVY